MRPTTYRVRSQVTAKDDVVTTSLMDAIETATHLALLERRDVRIDSDETIALHGWRTIAAVKYVAEEGGTRLISAHGLGQDWRDEYTNRGIDR